MEPIKQNLKILGSNVYYWEYNADKSPTILMIHGFRGNHFGLQSIVEQLPDYRIIVPDLPGFGESTPMDQEHNITGYVQFIREFTQQLPFDRPILLGHSFGSIIASYAAAALPKTFRKLILVNPISSPALKGPRTMFTKAAIFYYWLGRRLPQTAGDLLLKSPVIVWTTSQIIAKTKDKALRKHIHEQHLTHFSTFQNRDVLLQAFRASVSATTLDHAGDITIPTLLIAGEIDDIAPLASQFTLENHLANVQLVVIPHVGHLIHYEAPQAAAAAIRRFLD